jgi:hypothetical protein
VFVVLVVAFFAMGFGIDPGDSIEWVLDQNEPDPFCNTEGAGDTDIRFALTKTSYVVLDIWDVGMTGVVRGLAPAGWYAAGWHSINWTGRGDDGAILPEGTYPYVLVVTDSSDQVVFTDTLFAHIACAIAVRGTRWSAIKALYR